MDHIVYKISLHIKAVRKETIEAGFVEPGLVIKQLNFFFSKTEYRTAQSQSTWNIANEGFTSVFPSKRFQMDCQLERNNGYGWPC